MKKRITAIAALVIITLALPVFSDTDHSELSVEKVLQQIKAEQNVSSIEDIDPEKISEELLEELGDAVMEETHHGAAHEFMDTMMGGEGSESLREAHIRMGYNYILSITGKETFPGWGMMGTMGNFFTRTWWYRYGGTTMMIIGLLLVAGIAAIIIMQTRQSGSFKNLLGKEEENPLDILDRRLARGEITEEEYERIKKKLTS